MKISSCIQATLDGGILLDIEVQPASKRIGITGFNNWRGRLSISVTAEAQQGKANEAVKHILSKIFEVDKASVEIVNGHTSRMKRIRIENINSNEIIDLIKHALEV